MMTKITRAEIARLLEIRRATVTMWQRRYPDFPQPVRVSGREYFRVEQLMSWLENRLVPAHVRHLHEPMGTTYADRLRRKVRESGHVAKQDDGMSPEHAMEGLSRLAENFSSASGYFSLIISLLYIQHHYPNHWGELWSLVAPSRGYDGHRALHAELREIIERLGNELPIASRGLVDRVVVPARADELGATVRIVARVGKEFTGKEIPVLNLLDLLIERLDEIRGVRAVPEGPTPSRVCELVARLLGPVSDGAKLHDPFCRTGELLAAVATRTLADRGREALVGLGVSGRSANALEHHLAQLRLGLLDTPATFTPHHGRWFGGMLVSPRSFDVVVANPPFNVALPDSLGEFEWPYGKPPKGNANYAWIQYCHQLLAEGGRAVVVMPNNASMSGHPRERDVRSAMVEDGVVTCVVALPAQLFPRTAIAATLWVMESSSRRGGEILLIDGRHLGKMASRARRVLVEEDIRLISRTYHEWRAGATAEAARSVQGLSRVVTVEEVRGNSYSLYPPVYVQPKELTLSDDGQLAAMAAELAQATARAAECDARAMAMLERLGI